VLLVMFALPVCDVHQEKHRTKIKEKLEKFNKEKLLDFCEILDVIVKVTTKKVSWLSFVYA
jgi:hypothetical protein